MWHSCYYCTLSLITNPCRQSVGSDNLVLLCSVWTVALDLIVHDYYQCKRFFPHLICECVIFCVFFFNHLFIKKIILVTAYEDVSRLYAGRQLKILNLPFRDWFFNLCFKVMWRDAAVSFFIAFKDICGVFCLRGCMAWTCTIC